MCGKLWIVWFLEGVFYIKRILMLFLMSLFLVGCGEPDVYDMLEKMKKEELERIENMTEEERKAEEEKVAQIKAEEEAKYLAELEQAKWEIEHTDMIYYSISRYSSDGKFVDPDRYVLRPLTETKLQMHKFENRGFNSYLDSKGIVVNSAFLGGTPRGKFDIYAVVWTSGGRELEDKVRVEVADLNISRGW